MKLSATALTALRALKSDKAVMQALRNEGQPEPFSVKIAPFAFGLDARFTVPTPVFRRLRNLGLIVRIQEYVVSPGMFNGEGRKISPALIHEDWRLSDTGRQEA